MIKAKDFGKKLDINVLWALFGQQTVPFILKDEFRLLDSIRIAIENLDMPAEAKGDKFSANEVRLAQIMMNLTHIEQKPGQDPKLSSLLRDSLQDANLRDTLFKIGK